MPDSGATIEIEGLDELVRKLNDLAQLDKVHAGLKAAALYLKGQVAQYPARKHITIQQVGGWASEKQRRWFFWALREGKIDVPYRRGVSPGSENLGKKWTIKYDQAKFEATVGNNVSYGPFVQGNKQTKMMQMIGWKTVETVAKEEKQRVAEYIFDAVRRAIGV